MKKIYVLLASCSLFTFSVKAQWVLTGNAVAAGNFLGTTNAQNLLFKANNTQAGIIDLTYSNTFFGLSAGSTPSSTNYQNAAFGYQAMQSNSSGIQNVAFGFVALSANTSGLANAAVGSQSLHSNTTGSYNSGFGLQTLYSNTSGTANDAFGSGALWSTTTGGYNEAYGTNALFSNSTGNYNAAMGAQALYASTSASRNTALGYQSMITHLSGTDNTATGFHSLASDSTGSYNSGFGDSTLITNRSGSGNTAIGFDADVNGSNYTNTTVIGYKAVGLQSNQVMVGNTSVTSIGGWASSGWTTFPSDVRFKKNVQENVPGLEFIRQLRPVTYNVDVKGLNRYLRPGDSQAQDAEAVSQKEKIIYTGFIAQEVEAAAKKLDYDFSGIAAPQNSKGLYGLRYSDFVVPLVKAVQQLGSDHDSLVNIIDSLKTSQAALQSQINAIAQELNRLKTAGAAPSLKQNSPNPFSSTTVIEYYLPPTASNAQLTITDNNGRILKDVAISNIAGLGQAIVNAYELPSGTYYYSLIVDGKRIDTKKMVLTK